MNKVIIYTNDIGNVSVCFPSGELTIEEVQAKDTPIGSLIVDSETLPNNDMDFFDAWRLINGKVSVDLNAAKQVTKDRLREERKALLSSLDVQFQRAQENGSDTTAIVAEKNRLRDITNLADEATTLDELRAITV